MSSSFLLNFYLVYGRIIRLTSSLVARIRLRLFGARVGKGLSVRGWLNLHISPASDVVIGDNVMIKSGFADNPVGGSLRTAIWVNRGGRLVIENGAGLSNCTIVCSQSVRIGANTLVGGATAIYDTDFHSLQPLRRCSDGLPASAAVSIGRDCFIGGHCIILKGVTIGDGSIVGAGSVVTGDVPASQLWAGNPARFIRPLS